MVNRSQRKGFTSDGKGGGTQISHHADNRGFSPFPLRRITAISTDATALNIVHCGVITLSGNSTLTASMPLASDIPGASYIVKALSVHSHSLTCSAEANGTRAFKANQGNTGSCLKLFGSLNDSVVLISDGVHFLVAGGSGSLSGT